MPAMNFYAVPPKDNLEQSLLTGDDDIIVAALQAAKKSARRKHLNEILLILSNTLSARVRNAAAIAMIDLHSEKIEEALINLLVREDTKKSRGTLLYVLDEIGASVPVDILTQVIATSRYEAREEALAFLKSGRIEWNTQKLQRSLRRLERMAHSKNAERSEAAERALRLMTRIGALSQLRSRPRPKPKTKIKIKKVA